MSAYAQDQKNAIGVNVMYGTAIENVGLGLKYQRFLVKGLRGEVGMDYYFENEKCKYLDANLNLHYVFDLSQRFKIYPLLGFTYAHTQGEVGTFVKVAKLMVTPVLDAMGQAIGAEPVSYYDENHYGANLGVGFEYLISKHCGVDFEVKYQITEADNIGIGLGFKYLF